MITYHHLWERLTSIDKLREAYEQARRGKTGNTAIREFAKLKKLLRSHERRDIGYNEILDTLQGWNGYASQGNTYHLRRRISEWTTQQLINSTEHRTKIVTTIK